jgi:hypothetical protein
MSREIIPIQFDRLATAGEVGHAVPLTSEDCFLTSGMILFRAANVGAVTIGAKNTGGVAEPREEIRGLILDPAAGREGGSLYNLKNYYMTAATEGDGVLIIGHQES